MTTAARTGRGGGLAFALGIGLAGAGVAGVGFAAATGTAATAWASPADSGRDAASEAATAHSGLRGQQVRYASRPPGLRSAGTSPGRTPRVKPAAAVSGPAPRVRASAGQVLAAAAAPLRTAPSPAPAAAVVSAPAAHQIGVTGPFANHQRTITILPKFPLGLPPVTIPFVRKVNGIATFTPKSVYDLHTVDQYDWNKLSGISFNIPGDVNSSLVAWRYNVTSGDFEVAPFFNVDKARILPTQADIVTVPIGETFDFSVDYEGITITYGDQTVYKATPEGLTPNFWTSYRTSVWFGGTSLPPKLIQLKLKVRS